MNSEHIEILKKGVEYWNYWRENNPSIQPDLSESIISLTPPSNAKKSELHIPLDFSGINMSNCNLKKSVILGANFSFANLANADFKEADLRRTNFSFANLFRASFHRTNLTLCNFFSSEMDDSFFWETVLARTDFHKAKNLDKTRHGGPSIIDHRTFIKSGKISSVFLKKIGMPEDIIKANKRYAQNRKSKSCFISHSSLDASFVEELYKALQERNIKCWYAPKDLDFGDKIRDEIDKAINKSDKLLIVLSSSSIDSYWVEDEVEAAIESEIKSNSIKLIPIMIENEVFESEKPWFRKIKRNRNIGDFSNVNTKDEFKDSITKLVRAINK